MCLSWLSPEESKVKIDLHDSHFPVEAVHLLCYIN